MRCGGGFGGQDGGEGVAKSGGVVAPESLFCSGRRNDFGAVDDRILEKGFIRGRKRIIKTLGNGGSGKVNILFLFRARLYSWKCSGGFEGGHPWRGIAGRLGPEESIKSAKSNGARKAKIMKGTGWGRVLDLVDEVFN